MAAAAGVPMFPMTTAMRCEAAQRFANDEELDDIERELRRDLGMMGATLAWDSYRWAVPLVTREDAPGGLRGGAPSAEAARLETADATGSAAAPRGGLGEGAPPAEAALAEGAAAAGAAAPPDDSEDDELDGFGEGAPPREPPALEADDGWCLSSREAFDLDGRECTLTTCWNNLDGLVSFEAAGPGEARAVRVICTSEEFAEACEEQAALPQEGRAGAAIRQLLAEAARAAEGGGGAVEQRGEQASCPEEQACLEGIARTRAAIDALLGTTPLTPPPPEDPESGAWPEPRSEEPA